MADTASVWHAHSTSSTSVARTNWRRSSRRSAPHANWVLPRCLILTHTLSGTVHLCGQVRGRLETLTETHRVRTQEYWNLIGRYNELVGRMQELNGLFGTFAGQAASLLNVLTMIPGMGATAGSEA